MATQSLTIEPTASITGGEWFIDPSRSRVHFHTRAMFGLFPVHGRFERFRGELHVDGSGRATGELQIEAASLATGIGKRDEHLRDADFFAANSHPYVIFELTDLAPEGAAYRVAGTLFIRRHSLPIEARASVLREGPELRIRAQVPVDHDSVGLGWAKPGLVRKVVNTDVELVLSRTQPRD